MKMSEPSYSSLPTNEQDSEVVEEHDRGSVSRSKKGLVLVTGLLALSALVATVFPSAHHDTSRPTNLAVEEKLKPSNELERRTGRILNDGLFENLVRVHSPTRLELESGNSAIFHVEKAPDTMSMIQLNRDPVSSLEHVFTEIGKHLVKAEVTYSDGSTSSFVFTVTAKVIRVELRDLTDEERDIYFDALQVFQFTSQSDGVATYGKKFKSLEYIVRQHLYGAADKACDHWHDDAGMVNHHVAITWQFEQSLRTIDPRTASHYWDFTREQGKGINWYESNIFDDYWFGSNSPNNDLHIVDQGRFAYSPVYKANDFSDVVNPYGLLRSPWNTNPTPYVMRYNRTFFSFGDSEASMPTCSEFASFMGSDLASLIFGLNGQLHGPVHIMIGGHWGNKKEWTYVSSKVALTDKFLLLSKFFWREGFIRTPQSCSDDTPHEDCMPTCPEGIIGEWKTISDGDAYTILDKAGIIDLNPTTDLHTYMTSSNLGWKDLLEELCHIGSPGEMFTSSAPQDPTFWPLHGNAERIVSLMRIYKKRGLIDFDETWGYSHQTSLPSDTGRVCDWSEATGTLDMPKCTTGICPGHKEEDLLPFTDLFKEQGDTLLTNGEFYSRINPWSDELPYAFDSLFYWEACYKHSLLEEFWDTDDWEKDDDKNINSNSQDDDDNDNSNSDSSKKFSWSDAFGGIWGVM
jgi:hypothetical protein